MTDEELIEAWRRGELTVVDADEETTKRLMAALDKD